MQNFYSNTMTPLVRSSSKHRGLERSSSNLRSPQLAQSSSANSLLNYRISQSALAKGLGSQSRLRLEKENDIRKQRDMSNDSLNKRLDSFFASTRNFIYSSTKMKNSMIEVIKEVDQQIDFNIKIFETDKQSLERCLNSLESQLFSIKDTQDQNYRSTVSHFDRSMTNLSRKEDIIAATQSLTDNNYVNTLKKENRNLKYEMQDLKQEIERLHLDKISSLKSQDHLFIPELEQLQKQVTKLERKASERKVCIKKLYILLENKDKELEDFKNYQRRYPIPAVINMISHIKKYDSSKKMQSYIEMAVKEIKLSKLLSNETEILTNQKKQDIEEMIHFLKVESKEIIKYFASKYKYLFNKFEFLVYLQNVCYQLSSLKYGHLKII